MANMLRTPLRRNVTSALVRAQTTSSLRTFQAPAQILIQQRARIHEKTPDQQQPQTQSKETRKNPQSPPKQAESSKTQSKQKKDAKGGENKSVNSDRDDLDDIKHILLGSRNEIPKSSIGPRRREGYNHDGQIPTHEGKSE